MTTCESPTHPDAPRAGGETPTVIDPDVYRRLDSFATGSPESDEHREDVYALLEAFDALRASLLERHRDGERAEPDAWLVVIHVRNFRGPPMTNPPSVPSLDVEAQPDPPKLESRVDLHRTATQPEKEGLAAGSGTPLDVEACVQLCLDAQLSWAYFGDAEKAELFGALASALPGMGKAEERLRRIREQCRVIYYGTPDMYPIEHAPGANKDSWEWMMLHLDADAARAAQPEETSADDR